MTKSRVTDAEILAQIPGAIARAARARRTKPYAKAARYDRATRTLRVRLTNDVTFSIPVSLIPALAQVSDVELSRVEVGPAGIGLHWDRLNVDLTIGGLARAALGTRALMQAAGAAGGRVRSAAKAGAARENGKRGGRPRRTA